MSKTPPKASARRSIFPPRPVGMKGRSGELSTLARTILATRPTRVALIGPGGSGKSMLVTALGHKLHPSGFQETRRVSW
jgi:DNA replication protein DnaC